MRDPILKRDPFYPSPLGVSHYEEEKHPIPQIESQPAHAATQPEKMIITKNDFMKKKKGLIRVESEPEVIATLLKSLRIEDEIQTVNQGPLKGSLTVSTTQD